MSTTAMYSTAFVVLGVVSSGLAWRAVDYRLLRQSRILTDETCVAAGLMCKDCANVQSCTINDPTNPTRFTTTVLETCNDTSHCLNGACVLKTTLNPFCQDVYDTFTCPSEGLFPDPVYCQKYYFCVPQTSEPDENGVSTVTAAATEWNCEGSYAYNAKSKVCDKPLVNNKCTGYPVPVCTRAGQTGPLPENPSIYYICGSVNNVLYPYLNSCSHGKTYRNNWGCA